MPPPAEEAKCHLCVRNVECYLCLRKDKVRSGDIGNSSSRRRRAPSWRLSFLHAQNTRHAPLQLRHRTNVPRLLLSGNAVRLREKLIHKPLCIEVASGPDFFSSNVRSSLLSRLFFRLLSPTVTAAR